MVAEELLQEVLAVVPDAPVDVIRRCLLRTKNAELTISLYMDGLLSECSDGKDRPSAETVCYVEEKASNVKPQACFDVIDVDALSAEESEEERRAGVESKEDDVVVVVLEDTPDGKREPSFQNDEPSERSVFERRDCTSPTARSASSSPSSVERETLYRSSGVGLSLAERLKRRGIGAELLSQSRTLPAEVDYRKDGSNISSSSAPLPSSLPVPSDVNRDTATAAVSRRSRKQSQSATRTKRPVFSLPSLSSLGHSAANPNSQSVSPAATIAERSTEPTSSSFAAALVDGRGGNSLLSQTEESCALSVASSDAENSRKKRQRRTREQVVSTTLDEEDVRRKTIERERKKTAAAIEKGSFAKDELMVIVGNLLETEAPLEKIRRTGFSIIDGSEYNTLIEPIPDAVQFVFDRSRPFRRGLRPFFEEIDASDGPVCVGEILVLWTAQRFHSTLVCGELAHEAQRLKRAAGTRSVRFFVRDIEKYVKKRLNDAFKKGVPSGLPEGALDALLPPFPSGFGNQREAVPPRSLSKYPSAIATLPDVRRAFAYLQLHFAFTALSLSAAEADSLVLEVVEALAQKPYKDDGVSLELASKGVTQGPMIQSSKAPRNGDASAPVAGDVARFLSSLPGVSDHVASMIERRYPSLRALFTACEREGERVFSDVVVGRRVVGDTVSRRVHRFLTTLDPSASLR